MAQGLSLHWRAGGAYEVLFAEGLLGGQGDDTGDRGSEVAVARSALATQWGGLRALLLTSPTPWHRHRAQMEDLARASGVDLDVMVESLDEPAKTIDAVLRVCARAEQHRLGRADLLVAFGGGICCDVVRVAAASYRRGIDYVCLPTTLVGQIDAGIGIKGAVNFAGVKSRMGSFHAPRAVFNDPRWLSTLSLGALRAGLSEMVKLAVMRDERLFALLEEHGGILLSSAFQHPKDVAAEVLQRAARGMLEELSLDPFERDGQKRRMDFGHTYSPLLEQMSGFRIGHGQAVAVDMALSCEIAVGMGICDRAGADRILAVLARLGLPLTTTWCHVDGFRRALVESAAHRGGSLRMPLPAGIGEAVFVTHVQEVTDGTLRAALAGLRSRAVA